MKGDAITITGLTRRSTPIRTFHSAASEFSGMTDKISEDGAVGRFRSGGGETRRFRDVSNSVFPSRLLIKINGDVLGARFAGKIENKTILRATILVSHFMLTNPSEYKRPERE